MCSPQLVARPVSVAENDTVATPVLVNNHLKTKSKLKTKSWKIFPSAATRHQNKSLKIRASAELDEQLRK